MNQVRCRGWLWSRVFLACVCSAAANVYGWAQEPQVDVLLFESFDGTFVSAKQSALRIKTVDGDKVFQLAKTGDDLPQLGVGRGTAISVSGVERISFLKSAMTIRFVAELDKTGPTDRPIEVVEVLSISDKLDTLRGLNSQIDPQTGIGSYRFIARIQSIDRKTNRLGVIVRTGNKSERFEFALDPEKTRVSYDLPDLSLAQPGEAILVRCLPFPEDSQVASEVRVTRPSPFADAANQNAANANADALALKPNQTMDNETPARPTEPGGNDEGGMDDDSDAVPANSDTPNSEIAADRTEPSDDVVEFDFDAPVPSEPTFDYGLLSLLLAIEIPKSQAAISDAPAQPTELEGRSIRPGQHSGRRWYKIN